MIFTSNFKIAGHLPQAVAAWLRKHTGVVVEEFTPRLRRHKEWLKEMEGAA